MGAYAHSQELRDCADPQRDSHLPLAIVTNSPPHRGPQMLTLCTNFFRTPGTGNLGSTFNILDDSPVPIGYRLPDLPSYEGLPTPMDRIHGPESALLYEVRPTTSVVGRPTR